ncbi:hypothetical protein GCM10009087_05880 [Sphingomonas oligophenolica]
MRLKDAFELVKIATPRSFSSRFWIAQLAGVRVFDSAGAKRLGKAILGEASTPRLRYLSDVQNALHASQSQADHKVFYGRSFITDREYRGHDASPCPHLP